MSECDICAMIASKEAFNLIYEDEHCLAFLHEAPSNEGHVILIPKQHLIVFEELSDELVAHLTIVANRISIGVFESLGAHGTNILINNGPNAGQEFPHFMINIIPRYENDGVNLDWEMKQAKPDDLKMTKNLIESSAGPIFYGIENKPVEISDSKEVVNEESLMIKELRRFPN